MEASERDIALLNSLFYLAFTEIPVSAIFGQGVVLFNHSNGTVAMINPQGNALLEPGGIYTSEHASSPLLKNATVAETPDPQMKLLDVKLRRVSIEARSLRAKRQSMVSMPGKSLSSASIADETIFWRKKRPSSIIQQDKSLSNMSRATSIDSRKSFHNKEALQSASSMVLEEEDDLINMLKYGPQIVTDVDSPVVTPTIVTPDSRKWSVFSQKQPSETDLLKPQADPLLSGKKKLATKDFYEGCLNVCADGQYKEFRVRLNEDTLSLYEPYNPKEAKIEVELNGAVATADRKSFEYAFEIVQRNEVSYKFIAPNYKTMIEWLAVINSVAISLNVESFRIPKDQESIVTEVFMQEHDLLTLFHQSLNQTPRVSASLENIFNLTSKKNKPKLELFQFEKAMAQGPAYLPNGDPTVTYKSNLNATGNQYSPFAGMTLEKLVEALTSVHLPKKEFVEAILLGFRAFTTFQTLFTKLAARYSPQYLEDDSEIAIWDPILKLRQVKVNKRVINIVLGMMKMWWKQEFNNPENKKYLLSFIEIIFTDSMQESTSPISRKMHSLQSELRELAENGIESDVKEPKLFSQSPSNVSAFPSSPTEKMSNVNFIDLDPGEFTHVMTYWQFSGFEQITPVCFALHLWGSHKDPAILEELKPINRLVEQFNHVSFWVATEVCTQPEIKKRAKVVERFIKIANKCFRLYNFDTTMAIVSGLSLVSVSRLKATWEMVEARRMKQLASLEEALSPVGNYKNYRAILEELGTSRPHVPILSLFLKDLLFSNDGNPTFNANEKGERTELINIPKFEAIYEKINTFCKSVKNSGFSTKDSPEFTTAELYYKNIRALKEAPLYKYSCLCEPKGGDDVLRLREKWMNGT